MEIVRESKRYVIAGGRWRQQRDEERRAARLAKAEKQLQRLAAVRCRRSLWRRPLAAPSTLVLCSTSTIWALPAVFLRTNKTLLIIPTR